MLAFPGPRGQVRLMPSGARKSRGNQVRQVWVRAYASAFLTSSQVMLLSRGQTLSSQTVDLTKGLDWSPRAGLHRQHTRSPWATDEDGLVQFSGLRACECVNR